MASMAAFAFLVFYLARLPLLIEFCRYGWGLEVAGEVRDPSKLIPEGSELRACLGEPPEHMHLCRRQTVGACL